MSARCTLVSFPYPGPRIGVMPYQLKLATAEWPDDLEEWVLAKVGPDSFGTGWHRRAYINRAVAMMAAQGIELAVEEFEVKSPQPVSAVVALRGWSDEERREQSALALWLVQNAIAWEWANLGIGQDFQPAMDPGLTHG